VARTGGRKNDFRCNFSPLSHIGISNLGYWSTPLGTPLACQGGGGPRHLDAWSTEANVFVCIGESLPSVASELGRPSMHGSAAQGWNDDRGGRHEPESDHGTNRKVIMARRVDILLSVGVFRLCRSSIGSRSTPGRGWSCWHEPESDHG
jgi:hypothetical protein